MVTHRLPKIAPLLRDALNRLAGGEMPARTGGVSQFPERNKAATRRRARLHREMVEGVSS
jgi:hypothetical protein